MNPAGTPTGRVGVPCKWLNADGSPHAQLHFQSLTRQNYRRFGDTELRRIAFGNVRTLHALVCMLGAGPVRDRMFRIGNHVMPCRTLPEAAHAWRDRGFVQQLANAYRVVGARARQDGVRLSTHPDQFIVPNSLRADVRARSIAELDAWGECAAWMGYGARSEFCTNVHLGSRAHVDRATLVRSWHAVRRAMSAQAWRVLTVENDDRHWSAWDLLHVARCARFRPVVDVHHHWCVMRRWPHPGALEERVPSLWEGVRPKVHVSLPRAEFFADRDADVDEHDLPRWHRCNGPRQPHAQLPWCGASYVRELLRWSDVMLELKRKNCARTALWNGMRNAPDEQPART